MKVSHERGVLKLMIQGMKDAAIGAEPLTAEKLYDIERMAITAIQMVDRIRERQDAETPT